MIAERTSLVRLRKEGRKLAAALGRAALSTPEIIGQVEKVARTGTIPTSLSAKDLRALSQIGRNDLASEPQIIPAALFISAAILADTMQVFAIGIAGFAVTMIISSFLRRKSDR